MTACIDLSQSVTLHGWAAFAFGMLVIGVWFSLIYGAVWLVKDWRKDGDTVSDTPDRCYKCDRPSSGTISKEGQRRPICQYHAEQMAMYDDDTTYRAHLEPRSES